jgi:N6-adenosine-specific RNA methylase IME4
MARTTPKARVPSRKKRPIVDWDAAAELLAPRYRTFYADPPWFLKGMYGKSVSEWAAKRGYAAMTLQQLKEVPIQDLWHPDGCHLYLWSSNALLPDSLELMKFWGFDYITAITWLKEEPAVGYYYRSMTEQCLFGVRHGKGTRKNLPVRTVKGEPQRGETAFYSPREAAFRKPDKMREIIEKVSYPRYLEIWPKETFPHWDTWDGAHEPIRRNLEDTSVPGRPEIIRGE